MKNPTLLVFAGLSSAGLIAGFAARKLTANHSFQSTASAISITADKKTSPSGPNAANKISLAEIPHLHSTDTLESLLAEDHQLQYGRLALWLMDASEQDIATFWKGFSKKKRGHDLSNLVFIYWTRLNPQTAVAAVIGTPAERYAWQGWAYHDAQASLTAAIAAGPKWVGNVAWAISQAHPDWARAHLNEIPEAAKPQALAGMTNWEGGEKPLETLDFMRKNGGAFNAAAFKAAVRDDPWAALAWIKQNPSAQSPYIGQENNPMNILLRTMNTEQPDELIKLAAQTPPGALKRQIDAAIFDHLIASDPAAALAQAKATESPIIASELLGKIGLSVISKDPEKAFEAAQAIFTTNPGDLNFQFDAQYPNGSTSGGGNESTDSANQLFASLLNKDPARLMDMVGHSTDTNPNGSPEFSNLTSQWASLDLTGYVEWVNHQSDPAVHDPAVGSLINRLTSDGRYSEAAEWAANSQSLRSNQLPYLLGNWTRTNADEAFAWLENAKLSEAEKTNIKKVMEGYK